MDLFAGTGTKVGNECDIIRLTSETDNALSQKKDRVLSSTVCATSGGTAGH